MEGGRNNLTEKVWVDEFVSEANHKLRPREFVPAARNQTLAKKGAGRRNKLTLKP